MDYYQFGHKIRKEVKMSNAHKPSKPRARHRAHYKVVSRKKAQHIGSLVFVHDYSME